MLKKIGFFKELKHGNKNGDSLNASICAEPDENEELIIQYLESGLTLCVSPGIVRDVIDDKNDIIGSLSILTDGAWCWPTDLIYYVKKYHVALNNEFISHMINNRWLIPDKESINITTAT